jgi:hypothetical protein
MSDKVHVHIVPTIELRFERQDHRHIIYQSLDGPDSTAPPCPNLRTDVIEYFDAKPPGHSRQKKVEIREINQNNDMRGITPQVRGYRLPGPIDSLEMTGNLRKTHDRETSMVHKDSCPCPLKERSSHAGHLNVGSLIDQRPNKVRPVKITRSLACT